MYFTVCTTPLFNMFVSRVNIVRTFLLLAYCLTEPETVSRICIPSMLLSVFQAPTDVGILILYVNLLEISHLSCICDENLRGGLCHCDIYCHIHRHRLLSCTLCRLVDQHAILFTFHNEVVCTSSYCSCWTTKEVLLACSCCHVVEWDLRVSHHVWFVMQCSLNAPNATNMDCLAAMATWWCGALLSAFRPVA